MSYSFEKSLTDFLTGKNSKKPVSVGIWFGLIVLSVDKEEKKISNFSIIRKILSPLKSKEIKSLKNTFLSFLSVDDRFDQMPPDKILSYGDRPELRNDKLCDFAKNFATEHELNSFLNLSTYGLLTEKQTISSLNLISQLMWDEASHAKDFLESKSLESRCELKEKHLDMGKYIVFTFSSILSRGENIRDINNLSMDVVEKIFPKSSKIGVMAQKYDDLFDVFRDIHEEISYSRPSGNVVLEKLHKDGKLVDKEGNLNHEITSFYDKIKDSQRPIQLLSIPPSLRQAILETKNEILNEIEQAPIRDFYKTVFKSSLNSTLREGLKPPTRSSTDKTTYEIIR